MKPVCLTIKSQIKLSGAGLHSGRTTTIQLLPKETVGIEFIRTDLSGAEPLTVMDIDVDGPPLRTLLKRGSAEIQTIEHLLSSAVALGVFALTVECDGPEIPGLDGSAMPFAEAILRTGVRDIRGDPSAAAPVIIREPIRLGNEKVWLLAEPSETGEFVVGYKLHYENNRLAQGELEIVVTPETFRNQIAPARTFCMKAEADALLAMGFGKGATTENTLVIDGDSPLDTILRYPDEPVRHKILDLLGDLALAGRPIVGKITGCRSGHALNRRLAMTLRDQGVR